MVNGDYLGMPLSIEDVDGENLAYFRSCAEGVFRLQRGRRSGLLRYPPTTACPWTRDREYDWVEVEGRGTVHSYGEVHHAIHPAFRAFTPYLVLLVDLDTQKGVPSEDEALRVIANLVTPRRHSGSPGRRRERRHRHPGADGLHSGRRRHRHPELDCRRVSDTTGKPVALPGVNPQLRSAQLRKCRDPFRRNVGRRVGRGGLRNPCPAPPRSSGRSTS